MRADGDVVVMLDGGAGGQIGARVAEVIAGDGVGGRTAGVGLF